MNELHSKRIRIVVATSLSDLGGDFLRSRHAKLDGIANMRASNMYGSVYSLQIVSPFACSVTCCSKR
jgi:hypothetical protein